MIQKNCIPNIKLISIKHLNLNLNFLLKIIYFFNNLFSLIFYFFLLLISYLILIMKFMKI
jgi:hypothetical protein